MDNEMCTDEILLHVNLEEVCKDGQWCKIKQCILSVHISLHIKHFIQFVGIVLYLHVLIGIPTLRS